MVLKQIRPRRISRCIFCPNPAETKEHAWEDWAVQRIQIHPTIIHGHIGGQAVEVPQQKAIRVKCLCTHCNTIWLNRVVEATLPFLAAMAQDISITLDIPQQHILAHWAVTRAMVWEYCNTEPRPLFYSDQQRLALKANGQLPPNTSIWFGRYVTETNLAAWVSDYTKPIRSHVTTISYKHLIVQILTVRPDQSVRPGTILNPKPGPWPEATVRILPTIPLAIWPPRLSIGSDVSETDFRDRWNHHPPGELIPL